MEWGGREGEERYIWNTTEASSSKIRFVSLVIGIKWDALNPSQFLAVDHTLV